LLPEHGVVLDLLNSLSRSIPGLFGVSTALH
jgi:hypothetical protein